MKKTRNFKINERQGQVVILALEVLLHQLKDTTNDSFKIVLEREANNLRNDLMIYQWEIDK